MILSSAIYMFYIYEVKKKKAALFCFLSDAAHKIYSSFYVCRTGSLLLFIPSNVAFISVIRHSMFNLFRIIFWYEVTYDQKKKTYYIKIRDRMLMFGVFASYLRNLHFAAAEGPYPIT